VHTYVFSTTSNEKFEQVIVIIVVEELFPFALTAA